jgi:hypothetical protein
VLQDHLFTPL